MQAIVTAQPKKRKGKPRQDVHALQSGRRHASPVRADALYAARLTELFRASIAEQVATITSSEGGWCRAREQIATRLGITLKTFQSWLSPSEERVVPLHVLAQCACREDVLDADVRGRLVAALCLEAGYEPPTPLRTGEAAKDWTAAAMAAAAAAGKLAQTVSAATSELGEAGRAISHAERVALTDAIEQLARATQAARAVLGGGGE
jgi:hypothetical protein